MNSPDGLEVSPMMRMLVDHAWVVLLALLPKLWQLLHAKTQGTEFDRVVSVVEQLVGAAVARTRVKIDEALADGVVTKAELDSLVKDVLSSLPAASLAVVEKQFGANGIGVWVTGLVEAAITSRQHDLAKAAGAAARARIDDIETALSAARARAAGVEVSR